MANTESDNHTIFKRCNISFYFLQEFNLVYMYSSKVLLSSKNYAKLLSFDSLLYLVYLAGNAKVSL